MAKSRRSSGNSVNKLTAQVKAQIVEDFDSGMPIEEITTRHGLTHPEYATRVIRKEKGDHVLPKTPAKKVKRQKPSVSEVDDVSDTESNHSYSLRSRTPQSATKITPTGRVRRPSHERNCDLESCVTGSKRKKARFLSPVAEPQHDDLLDDESTTDVDMEDVRRDLFEFGVDRRNTDPKSVANNRQHPTPQMLAQIYKRESSTPDAGSFLGSGLKQLFTGSLFGNKSTNTSFEDAALERRSVNLSPVFPSAARAAASVQTTKENIIEKSYVDFLIQNHQEELRMRDDMIADRDRRIAELERENRTLISDNKRLQVLESREKNWKKYF